MEEWQKRVFTEREELAMKIAKLEHFLDVTDVEDYGKSFNLLRRQLSVMCEYYDVLDERVKEFE